MTILKFTLLVGFTFSLLAQVSVAEDLSTTVTDSRSTIPSLQRLDDFETLLKTAYAQYVEKKYEEALAKCAEASRLRPTDYRPHAIAAYIYMDQWKLKSASDSFAKAISLGPDNERLHYYKARTDRFRNAKEEALVSVRKAIELKPSFAEAYLLLGDILGMGGGSINERKAAFQKAIKLKPELVGAYTALGQMLEWEKKDEKSAEEAFRTAMDVDPKKMEGRFELGRLLVKQHRLKEARELWSGRTTDKDNTMPNFIVVLERAERLEQAKGMLAQKPNDPDALLAMGVAVMDGDSWVVDGRQEKAIAYFRKALEIRKGFAAAQFWIVKAYVQIADTFRANNRNVDEELAKLRALDTKLADEAVEYRKTYTGGLLTSPATIEK